jgi:hypothetical protein
MHEVKGKICLGVTPEFIAIIVVGVAQLAGLLILGLLLEPHTVGDLGFHPDSCPARRSY